MFLLAWCLPCIACVTVYRIMGGRSKETMQTLMKEFAKHVADKENVPLALGDEKTKLPQMLSGDFGGWARAVLLYICQEAHRPRIHLDKRKWEFSCRCTIL